MSQIDTDSIRQIANQLQFQSVSSNADSHSPVTKQDLENLRNNVAKAINAIADILDN